MKTLSLTLSTLALLVNVDTLAHGSASPREGSQVFVLNSHGSRMTSPERSLKTVVKVNKATGTIVVRAENGEVREVSNQYIGKLRGCERYNAMGGVDYKRCVGQVANGVLCSLARGNESKSGKVIAIHRDFIVYDTNETHLCVHIPRGQGWDGSWVENGKIVYTIRPPYSGGWRALPPKPDTNGPTGNCYTESSSCDDGSGGIYRRSLGSCVRGGGRSFNSGSGCIRF